MNPSPYERRMAWSAANDDRGASARPPRPFFLTRFWRFDLPFAVIWFGGWGVYLMARFWA